MYCVFFHWDLAYFMYDICLVLCFYMYLLFHLIAFPSLSLSPDECVPVRASDQIRIETPQSRSGALTLRARPRAHTYVEKPRHLLGHYIRSGGQAKRAAKLRKTTHASSPCGYEHADCGRNSPLTGKQNWAGRVRRTPGGVSKVATVLSLCTSALPQDLHER